MDGRAAIGERSQRTPPLVLTGPGVAGCRITGSIDTGFWMGTIFALGVAAAVYPQLLAVVVVILTRPNPKPILWSCYLGGLVVSVGWGTAILAVFRSRGSVAGTNSHRLSPSSYVVVGRIALVVAIFAATQRGRELVGSDLPRVRHRMPAEPRSPDPFGG